MKRRIPLAVLIVAFALAPFAGAADASAKKSPVDFALDTKPLERVNTGGRLVSYADVIEKTTPAVVSITTAQVIRQMPRGRGDMNDLLRRMLEGGSPQAGEEEAAQQNARGVKRTVPLGLGYGIAGRSSVDPSQNSRAGDLEIGLSATYRTVWTGQIGFTHFFGPPDRQPFADRDFISISMQRTF